MASRIDLYLATGNEHKVDELRGLLRDCPITLHSAAVCGGMPRVVEDGETFAANALLKAAALRPLVPPSAWVLADDSGLEVDALGGQPGVRSARYAGESASDTENVTKLLNALNAQPEPDGRNARFRCVLCLLPPEGPAVDFEGDCRGHIATAATGASGFGYDPVFVPEGHRASFGVLGEATKQQLSHRAAAARALRTYLLRG
ncbi:MAG: RdgB/HAM1 family non-canonical purine NTP pyrophosphatase [Puniceicoccaceae bacterium]|nr:MAG: RdgB/HAM1 family non-canonical purine NTP pyrophosphatase [Puniceicoccaceae bacterium]